MNLQKKRKFDPLDDFFFEDGAMNEKKEEELVKHLTSHFPLFCGDTDLTLWQGQWRKGRNAFEPFLRFVDDEEKRLVMKKGTPQEQYRALVGNLGSDGAFMGRTTKLIYEERRIVPLSMQKIMLVPIGPDFGQQHTLPIVAGLLEKVFERTNGVIRGEWLWQDFFSAPSQRVK